MKNMTRASVVIEAADEVQCRPSASPLSTEFQLVVSDPTSVAAGLHIFGDLDVLEGLLAKATDAVRDARAQAAVRGGVGERAA